jgi:hypothetical protein
MQATSPKVAAILPAEAVELLRAAARMNPLVPVGLDAQRTRMVEYAIDKIKSKYPQFFRR